MKKTILAFIFFLTLTTGKLFSQDLPPIQLDRPDQTECPFITPAKYVQIENGFTYEKENSDQSYYSYPSTLWKYGVNEKFELRLITELVTDKAGSNTVTGLTPVTIGFKTSLCEEKGIFPKTSFIGHLTTSTFGSKEFQTNYVAPAFRFTMQHTLSSTLSLAYNLGAEWNGENAAQSYIYTLTTGISLTDKLGGYAEVYGFLPDGQRPDHRLDCGLTYLLHSNVMTDLSGGMGLTDNSPEYYVSVGFSFRFKTVN